MAVESGVGGRGKVGGADSVVVVEGSAGAGGVVGIVGGVSRVSRVHVEEGEALAGARGAKGADGGHAGRGRVCRQGASQGQAVRMLSGAAPGFIGRRRGGCGRLEWEELAGAGDEALVMLVLLATALLEGGEFVVVVVV